jgi:phosphoglycerol transferase
VDRDGYEDNGEVVVAELMSVLGQPLIEDGDGRRVVFKVPSQSSDNFDGLSAEQIIAKAGIRIENGEIRYMANLEDGIDFSKGGLPSFVKTVSGLSGVEEWGRWSDANLGSAVEITFARSLPKSFSLVVEGSAFGPNIGGELVIVCGKVSRKVLITSNEFIFSETFHLESEDVNVIRFIPSKPISPQQLGLSEDGRLIAIGFKELKILQS